eukprot:TRINITY_DN30998_c0_g1_i1.p1 TRINITY_DN30998_c0_g1~~TRINITY_DN30998_c0_g1_i1.p1  ORF type:complete len:420 (-),score=75.03 TRINITY_DN30998_c0_g1_i1:96-1355(-)
MGGASSDFARDDYDPMLQLQKTKNAFTSNERVWEPSDPEASMKRIESNLWNRAVLIWVLMPILVVCQDFIPVLQPTCSHGFRNWSFIGLSLLVLQHLYAERQTWAATKELLAPPEISVLRQLGVLRSRARYAVLGILGDLDLFTDVAFPFVVRACGDSLDEEWAESWKQVPTVGPLLADLVRTLGFWGIALIVISIQVLLSGLVGFSTMSRSMQERRKANLRSKDSAQFRINGSVFFNWARSAETANMPGIAMLCEEMASQKKWLFQPGKSSAAANQARRDFIHDKIDRATLAKSEVNDFEEQERVEAAGRIYFAMAILVKAFLGNALALWFQGSFMALTFDKTTSEAKIKLIVGMAISAVQAAVRCGSASEKLGIPGLVMSCFIMCFIVWSFIKVYHAYSCPDHLWNLTTGCVDTSGD